MSIENGKTLQAYDGFAKKYLDNATRHDSLDPDKSAQKLAALRKLLASGYNNLTTGSSVLEIGAGDGFASCLIKELGFRAFASDVAPDFLDAIHLKGLHAFKFNVLTDHLDRKFDGVLAWRVFVHFTPSDLSDAFHNISRLLVPGGRFIFNIMNKESKDMHPSGWFDFPGEYHMGVERFYQVFSRKEVETLLKKADLPIVDFSMTGGKDGKKWLCFTIEKPNGVNLALQEYIETRILPRYDRIGGHTNDHIRQVISRSLGFAEGLKDINTDMVYVIAAYHDLGREVDNEHHHLESAKMLLADQELSKYFNTNELKVMAEAVEDHRASLKREPRSIYGKIVSSADRNHDIDSALRRCYDSVKYLNPGFQEKDLIEKCRVILRGKYSPDGYAASKMYFKDPDFSDFLIEIEKITRDPDAFYETLLAFNQRRGVYDSEAISA